MLAPKFPDSVQEEDMTFSDGRRLLAGFEWALACSHPPPVFLVTFLVMLCGNKPD
jgi:hypothetical protein